MPGVAALSRRWRGLLVGLAIVSAAVLAALARPPVLGPQPALFAAFLSAAITATSLVPLLGSRHRRASSIALASAAALLVLGAITYVYAGSVQGGCIVHYNRRSVLAGTDMTPLGAEFKRLYPAGTAADLLDDAAGNAALIWTRESIERCRSRVASTYFLWIPFLTASLVSAALGISARRLMVPAAPRDRSAAVPVPADDPVRYDVFISYRHGGADAGVARQLAQALEADGYAVAIDERDFPANASFLQEMERCIRESRHTVAIVSSRYLQSGHCEEEAIVCKVLDMGQRRRRLIPFIIEPVPMPAWLFGIVGIDSTAADPLVDPFEKLKATLGPPQAVR
jgi:hypothetical protein